MNKCYYCNSELEFKLDNSCFYRCINCNIYFEFRRSESVNKTVIYDTAHFIFDNDILIRDYIDARKYDRLIVNVRSAFNEVVYIKQRFIKGNIDIELALTQKHIIEFETKVTLQNYKSLLKTYSKAFILL